MPAFAEPIPLPAPAAFGEESADRAGVEVPLEGARRGVRDARSAPAPLPCLSSNNSTDSPSRLTPYQRKNAFSINENLGFLIEQEGIEKVGFLTLTFPKNLSLREANRRFNSLASHFLDLHFTAWVCVREFTKGGRPHFHLIVACREDIRTGFDFGAYTEMTWMSSSPRRRNKFKKEIKALSRSLNPTPALRSIWRELHRVLPRYQFGRHELIPIRKSAEALSRYVGGYIRKSMDFRPVEAKGARLITYSKSFPRKVVGHRWSFNTDGSRLWRKKVAVFASLHRIKSMEQMADRFGSRWAWWLRDFISSINLAPLLAGEELVRYVNGLDGRGFGAMIASGLKMDVLHLYHPKLPEIGGKPIPPPRRLQRVIDWHLENWCFSRAQIAEAREAAKRLHREKRVYYTPECLAKAREKLLAAPQFSRAEVRARNYMRLCHGMAV